MSFLSEVSIDFFDRGTFFLASAFPFGGFLALLPLALSLVVGFLTTLAARLVVSIYDSGLYCMFVPLFTKIMRIMVCMLVPVILKTTIIILKFYCEVIIKFIRLYECTPGRLFHWFSVFIIRILVLQTCR